VAVKYVLPTVAVIAVSIAVATWGFGLSVERALLLSPVFVLSVGAAAAFVLITAKIVRESRPRRDPP
jgi:hypothetical protein